MQLMMPELHMWLLLYQQTNNGEKVQDFLNFAKYVKE